MNPSFLVAATLLLPLIGAVFIALTGSRPNLRAAVTLVTAGLLAMTVYALLQDVLAGGQPEATLVEVAPGLPMLLKVEPLGMLFACVASGLWIINSLYSIGYMRGNGETNQTRFYICFAIAISS